MILPWITQRFHGDYPKITQRLSQRLTWDYHKNTLRMPQDHPEISQRLPLSAITPTLSWDKPEITLSLSWDNPKIALEIPKNIPRYHSRDYPESTLRLPWDYPDITLRIPWDYPEITPKSQKAYFHCKSVLGAKGLWVTPWVFKDLCFAAKNKWYSISETPEPAQMQNIKHSYVLILSSHARYFNIFTLSWVFLIIYTILLGVWLKYMLSYIKASWIEANLYIWNEEPIITLKHCKKIVRLEFPYTLIHIFWNKWCF